MLAGKIEYRVNEPVSTEQFAQVLTQSHLGERRPMDDQQCLEGMITNSNLLVTAWNESQLVGIARSVTDYHFACYLSDLAVAKQYQRLGIGKQLLKLTQDQLGPNCKLILMAAPLANDYYCQLGFEHNPRCWVLERHSNIISEET